MAGFNISSFFNNSKPSFMSSFNFSDYASIKNGSYKKLVKAHYKMQKETATDKTDKKEKPAKTQKLDTTDKSGLTKMKSQADELKTSAKAFEKDDLWKQKNGTYDMDKIASAIKSFANEYNDVIDQSAKVSSKDVSMQTGFMTSLSKTMSNSLSKIGVTIGDDGKMSVDENALKNANAKDVKAMFSGKYSYASQIGEKASAISSAAARGAGTYSSDGSWSSTLSGMFNDWV